MGVAAGRHIGHHESSRALRQAHANAEVAVAGADYARELCGYARCVLAADGVAAVRGVVGSVYEQKLPSAPCQARRRSIRNVRIRADVDGHRAGMSVAPGGSVGHGESSGPSSSRRSRHNPIHAAIRQMRRSQSAGVHIGPSYRDLRCLRHRWRAAGNHMAAVGSVFAGVYFNSPACRHRKTCRGSQSHRRRGDVESELFQTDPAVQSCEIHLEARGAGGCVGFGSHRETAAGASECDLGTIAAYRVAAASRVVPEGRIHRSVQSHRLPAGSVQALGGGVCDIRFLHHCEVERHIHSVAAGRDESHIQIRIKLRLRRGHLCAVQSF